MKRIMSLIMLAILVGCSHKAQVGGVLKLYDDQKHLVFESGRILSVNFNSEGTAFIVLPEEDIPKLKSLGSGMKKFSVYIDQCHVADANFFGLFDTNIIAAHIGDPKKLIDILDIVGVNHTGPPVTKDKDGNVINNPNK
jgi:hypothetical protein